MGKNKRIYFYDQSRQFWRLGEIYKEDKKGFRVKDVLGRRKKYIVPNNPDFVCSVEEYEKTHKK